MSSNARQKIKDQVLRLARNGIALAGGGLVAQLAFTFLEVLIARKLGADVYGVFVTAYAWVVLGTTVIDFGTPLWTVQEGSRRLSRLPALLGVGLSVNVVVFGFLYLLLVVASRAVTASPVLDFMLILAPYGLILSMQNQLGAVYSSYQTMHVNAFFQGLAPVLILSLYFVWSATEMTLSDVGFAYVTGGGIVTGVWFAYTLRRIRPRFSARNSLITLRSSWQYGVTSFLGQVFFKTDIVMLSALAGVREAGIYAAASKLVDLVTKVAILLGRVFAPAIFKASHESWRSFRLFASMMMRVLAIAGLLAGLVSAIMAEEIIFMLFGESYAGSVPILRILAAVMATRCMMVALQQLLSSIDLHLQRVSGLAITIAAHVAANAVLIPLFGAVGAASAAAFSGLLLVLLYARSAARSRGFNFLRWLLLPASVAGLAAALAVLSGMNGYLQAATAVTAFLAGLVISGFVERHELKFVLRTIAAGGGD